MIRLAAAPEGDRPPTPTTGEPPMPSIEARIAALEGATGKLCALCCLERELSLLDGGKPSQPAPTCQHNGRTFADELQALDPATRQAAP